MQENKIQSHATTVTTATCQVKAVDLDTSWNDAVAISYNVHSTYTGTSNSTTSCYYPTVNNTRFLYYVECYLHYLSSTQNIDLYGVQIEYNN